MVSYQMMIWINTKHQQVKSVMKEREEKEQVYYENCLMITKQKIYDKYVNNIANRAVEA